MRVGSLNSWPAAGHERVARISCIARSAHSPWITHALRYPIAGAARIRRHIRLQQALDAISRPAVNMDSCAHRWAPSSGRSRASPIIISW
jgi:hypothetical protein